MLSILPSKKRYGGYAVFILMLTLSVTCLWSQTRPTVSMPVQKIVRALRTDPHLLKAVRNSVIEQAQAEGRVVRPADITDEALFRLIAEDPSVAIIAAKLTSASGTNAAAIPSESDTSTLAFEGTAVTPQRTETSSATAVQQLPSAVVDAVESQRTAANQENEAESPRPSAATIPSKPAVPKESNRLNSADSVFQSVRHPYARVKALDDLYSQVAAPMAAPERFGINIFQNGTGNTDSLPMDMPVGPDYVIGPGDGLKIELWGGISQRLQRIVDREGRVALPEAGLVQLSGKTLGEAQQCVQTAMRAQFRDIQVEISLTRLRSVRVYVVGDVERPGAYDISALSTPLNALYAAGGPTERGSMRTLRHYRGKQLIQEVDIYELLLAGVHSGVQRIESGDTVLIPPIGRQATIDGMVRRPAIYELRGENNLDAVLELAGGVLPVGSSRHIDIERVQEHEKRVMLSFDFSGSDSGELKSRLQGFSVADGDAIRISPIAPYSEKSVYVDGHVFNPGKRAWHEGMTVKDVVSSYADLLPEPYRNHAEIIRLLPPDYRPQVIGFDLSKVLEGGDSGPALQPFDTMRVFGRYDFEDSPEVTVSGEVRSPGPHRMNGETRLSDAIYLAGGLTPDALLDNVHVYREVEGSVVQVFAADLKKAMSGMETENIFLLPRDQVVVHRNTAKVDPAVVYIGGRVVAPGRYPLGQGMTAADLVRAAGGLRRGAFTETADLTRIVIEKNENGTTAEVRQVRIAEALAGNKDADIELRDGDVLSIRQIAGWEDIGASITVRGEVAHSGTYGITPGEKLSSVLKRAGGFYRGSYPQGAVLTRVEVKRLAEKAKEDLLQRLQDTAGQPPDLPTGTNTQEQVAAMKAAQAQQKQMIDELKTQEVDGRLVLRISDDIAKWENGPNDIEVRNGDVLYIPKKPTFVLVSGQVYNRAALTWVPGKRADWYLRNAGGPTENANKKAIFIIRADGSVVGQGSGKDVLSVKLQPGDSIVVPEKILSTNSKWRSLLGVAQLMSAFALNATVFKGL